MGQIDIPLNDTGRAQAEALREKMAEMPIEACYSSPLMRARETAEIVCRGRGIEVVPDKRIIERNCGRAQGNIVTNWRLYEQDETAEKDEDFLARAQSFVTDLLADEHEHILIVSHVGALRRVRHLLEEPEAEFDHEKWSIENAAMYKIELD